MGIFHHAAIIAYSQVVFAIQCITHIRSCSYYQLSERDRNLIYDIQGQFQVMKLDLSRRWHKYTCRPRHWRFKLGAHSIVTKQGLKIKPTPYWHIDHKIHMPAV